MGSILMRNFIIPIVFFMIITGTCLAQTSGITSGAIYSIKSKLSGRVLNVTNSSSANNANVDNWTDTNSASQHWIVTDAGDGLYTLTNVASSKLLHLASSVPASGVNVNQYFNTSNNLVKWSIVDSGDGFYFLKSAADPNYVLALSDGTRTDGVNVMISQANGDATQKWSFKLQEQQQTAPTAEIADQVFAAWKTAYFNTRQGNEVVRGEGFWGVAEIMETVDDAFEVTGDAKYMSMFNEMYNLFVAREGQDWMWNEYNDDITWMVLACVRAHLFTGNTFYLNKAKSQFDKMYARALTPELDGTLIWKMGVNSKNSCINGPAMVACCYLAQATGDSTYYDKAIDLYTKSKLHLFNASTGKVNDSYYKDAATGQLKVSDWSSTYNQGTYLGAAVMLYNYTHDQQYLLEANRIAAYTRDNMFKSDVMNYEDGNDLQGFKGIFMRYIRRYIVDCNRPDFIPWIQLNAKVAYYNRNSKSVINTLWGTKTSETMPKAFGASTALSLLMNCPLSLEITKDAYQTIESENFDYLKGVIVENCPDGTLNLGGVKNGCYSQYNNVDFGFKGAASAEFRLSSATSGGTIEIRLGGTSGKLIGTAEITGTGDWTNYSTFTCPVANVKGLQNVCLVYKGDGYLFNINHFKFTEAAEASESNGLLGSYFSGSNFEKEVIQRVDSSINFNWAEQSPAVGIANDRYSARWTGKILPRYSGDYTFYIKSDNGRRVWINNELIIDKWINDWDVEYSGTINLTAGQKYDIKVEYFEVDGGANIKLEWKSAQQVREVIPQSQLFLPTGGFTASELNQRSADGGEVVIFPNPVTRQLNINSPGIRIENLVVTDLNGRIVYQNRARQQDLKSVDVSGLKSGVYLLKLKTDQNKTIVRKFVK